LNTSVTIDFYNLNSGKVSLTVPIFLRVSVCVPCVFSLGICPFKSVSLHGAAKSGTGPCV